MLLDLFPVVLAAGLLLLATGRPVFSGLVLFSLGAGFALADRTKREAVREPVVFSDMSELPHVFTHPQLYLPFAGPGLVIGGAFAAVAAGVGIAAASSRLYGRPVRLIALAWLGSARLWWALSRAAVARRRGGDAAAARTERRAVRGRGKARSVCDAARVRRSLPAPSAPPAVPGTRRCRRRHCAGAQPGGAACAGAMRIVFRRPPVVAAACRRSAAGLRRVSRSRARPIGRLDVAGWGANTMRAEFAVLTGIPEAGFGYDRFNPYHAFARTPLASLAWRLRAEGYRTVCLHPFDRGFFRRDLTIAGARFRAVSWPRHPRRLEPAALLLRPRSRPSGR